MAPSDGYSLSKMFESVALLCQVAQGTVPVIDALRHLSKTFDADLISLSRVDIRPGHHTAKVFSHNTRQRISEGTVAFDTSFAAAIVGQDLHRAKDGTVWFGTDDTLMGHSRLSAVYGAHGFEETAVMLLDKKATTADFLEMHFCAPITAEHQTNFETLVPILSDCWKTRPVGRFSDALLARGRVAPDRTRMPALLSADNPCGLSRAEYRVCLLLGRGLNNKAVISELSITMATLRKHLGNIYAKTGAGSQPELIHMLLSREARQSLPGSGRFHVA